MVEIKVMEKKVATFRKLLGLPLGIEHLNDQTG